MAACGDAALCALFEALLHRWAQELPRPSPLEAGALAAHLTVVAALSSRLAQAFEELCGGRSLASPLLEEASSCPTDGLKAALHAGLRPPVAMEPVATLEPAAEVLEEAVEEAEPEAPPALAGIEEVETPRVQRGSVQVALRLKPQTGGAPPDWSQEEAGLRDLRAAESWRFDSVLGPKASNAELFEACGRDVVEAFCDGLSGTVLAYGQTASGKTYTMQGDRKVKGLMQMAVDRVFERLEDGPHAAVSLSYFEIYNERVYDLLAEGTAEVRILEQGSGDVELLNLTRRHLLGPGDALLCLEGGGRRRRVAETLANDRSSRSHTVLQLNACLAQRGGGPVRMSQLNLVDLAGSESTKLTGATGQRLREGQSINRSLLALSQVVASLSEGQARVGFRDSKLTRVLQQSLVGNARTALVCTISTAEANYWETRRTLDFASRAKRIRGKCGKVQGEKRPDELSKLRMENEHLRMQATALSSKLEELQPREQQPGRGEALADVTNCAAANPARPGLGRKRAMSFGGGYRPAT